MHPNKTYPLHKKEYVKPQFHAARVILLMLTAAGEIQSELQEDGASAPLERRQEWTDLVSLFVPLPCYVWSQKGAVPLQGSPALS